TGEGIGLGLTIARDIIINKHQGELFVSNTDKGVRVKIELPVINYEGGE
ncbi:MAG TPA: hybrid sensor histidine kinase/response regulator, partial [Actinobacteria bacterium]|nr:hybrid sensor histidine kinase/response regulator [Actinomycetota bacterium]